MNCSRQLFQCRLGYSGRQDVTVVQSTTWKGQTTRTCVDLVDNLLRRLFVEIVYYDIRAAGTIEQRVPERHLINNTQYEWRENGRSSETAPGACDDYYLTFERKGH